MGRHSCSEVRVAGVGGSGGVWWETVVVWMGGWVIGVLESVGGTLGASHPPPNLPPGRGEGPEGER